MLEGLGGVGAQVSLNPKPYTPKGVGFRVLGVWVYSSCLAMPWPFVILRRMDASSGKKGPRKGEPCSGAGVCGLGFTLRVHVLLQFLLWP